MAPTIPPSRSRNRLLKSTRPSQYHIPHKETPSKSFLDRTSKQDKRIIKHSVLLSRISKSHPSPQKSRRRPSKKLVTTLDSLADALPDAPVGGNEKAEAIAGEVKMRHKSLRSRPGRAKRREKEVRSEKERFEKNMARMMAGSRDVRGSGEGYGKSGERWKALRGFIEQTMEKRADLAL